MRVLILEPHATGHHASYLRWLVQAIQNRNWSAIIATTDDALSHPALTAITSDFNNVTIHSMRGSSRFIRTVGRSSQLIRSEFGYWRVFRRAVSDVRKKCQVDLVILPYVDYCFYPLAIMGAPFRGIPWCGISMRLAVTGKQRAVVSPLPWKWRMAKRLLTCSNLKALFVINPSISDVPGNWYSAWDRSRLRYLPDPAEFEAGGSRSDTRANLGVSDKSVAMLVFGSIDERKGIDSLIAAVASQEDLASYVVILAGRQSANIRTDMSSPEYERLLAQKRLIVLDRFVSAADLGSLLAASDVVWVGYRNHIYMSGVLVLAAKAGLPVVGTMEGEIGRLIGRHALGTVARIDQPAEVAIALRGMLDGDARIEMGRRAKTAFANHTVENFGATVLSAFDA